MRVLARTLTLLFAILGLGVGCPDVENPLGANFFQLSVVASATCGTTRSVHAGGEVEVCLELLMGPGGSGIIAVSATAPTGVDASDAVGSFTLQADELRIVPVRVLVAPSAAAGTYTVSIDATCCSGAAASSASLDVTVLGDPDPPVITIRQPQPATIVGARPTALDAEVSDNGTVWRVTYQLNDDSPQVAWDLDDPRSWDEPRTGLFEFDVDMWDLQLGANTLEVVARDGAGNQATTSVGFMYEPTGFCADFEMDLLPPVLEGSPDDLVETLITVTPLGGWAGTIRFRHFHKPPDAAASFRPGIVPNVTGPVTSTFWMSGLQESLPGESYRIVLRVEDDNAPERGCDAELILNVVDPGSVQPPMVLVRSPLEGDVVTDATINLVGDATDDGTIVRVRYSVQELDEARAVGVEVFTGASTSPVTFDEVLTLTEPGGNRIDVWAVDEGGRVGAADVFVTYQVGAPTPPSSTIVFESRRNSNLDIYGINPDQTGLTRLTTDPADDREPVWSPDRTQIAFVTNRDGNDEIYTMSADGVNQGRLIDLAGSDRRPAYSPDGRRIAFDNDGDGDDEVFVMNSDGTGVTQLTVNTIEFDQGPSWSRHGRQILFTTFRDGRDNIYVMNDDGTGQALRIDTGEDDYQPDWSPDGRRIVFTSQDADGDDEIFVVNADGTTGLRQLTFNTANDEDPTWSPDSNWIAFTSNRGGNSDIYIMTADGQNLMQVTTDLAKDVRPSWVH